MITYIFRSGIGELATRVNRRERRFDESDHNNET